ncbi:uncharacterized protein LOC144160455 [Haemaphysalis longicornis]
MAPKKPGVACMRCEREYPLEETRFNSLEAAEGQDFMCRMCVMESHLDRLEEDKEWQRYLEDSRLYPNTVIGFRNKLGTQDAMIQLKNEILDDTTNTQDNRAILGLDLQSAFDKVSHSAILAQVSRLNMGKRTYAYIKDFLTGRTTEVNAGDLRLREEARQCRDPPG